MAVVALPAGAVVVPHPVDVDQATTPGFHQGTAQERRLPEDVSAIAAPQRFRFLLNVEQHCTTARKPNRTAG